MSICLSMIVKNETAELPRSLTSIMPFIDRWVVVDTGSTDGTPEMIESLLAPFPGYVSHKPWVNWGHNRSEALALAQREGCDWILRLDADDELIDVVLPADLNPTCTYYVDVLYQGFTFARELLLNAKLEWKFIGATHEYLQSYTKTKSVKLLGYIKTNPIRAGKTLDRFIDDVRILEAELKEDPNNARNTFYLAQSYKDSLQPVKAIEMYKKRASMGGWVEEVYISLLRVAQLSEGVRPLKEVVDAYVKAHEFRPERAGETLRHLARYCMFAGANCKLPNDILFMEKMFYSE